MISSFGGMMPNDEIEGKIAVLEAFTMMALGLHLANASNDPDFSKAKDVLDALRDGAWERTSTLSLDAKREARRYSANLIAIISANLRTLRGETGGA